MDSLHPQHEDDGLTPTAKALHDLQIRSGRSVREAAEAAGFASTNTYTHYYSRKFKKRWLPRDLAENIARALVGYGDPPVTEAEVMALAGVEGIGSGIDGAALIPNATIAVDGPRPRPITDMKKGLPVRGSAQGGPDGVFLLNMTERPIDVVPMPPGLIGVEDAFAVYVEGDSMEPWAEAGELIYVHPKRPARAGNYVVVEFLGDDHTRPPAAMVKRLVRSSASYVELLQYNPKKTFRIHRDKIVNVFRVLTTAELLGTH